MKVLHVICCAVLAIIFAGCSASKSKSAAKPSNLVGTYWRLTEAMGRPVGPTPADAKEIHIRLLSENNEIQGFGGCNGFGGKYELKEHNRIAISNVVGTMMACDRLEIENPLLEALRTADSYYLDNKNLVLIKGRMAPLARFEAVTFK